MRIAVVIIMVFLMSCSKNELEVLEGTIPFYKEDATELRVDMEKEKGVKNSMFTFATDVYTDDLSETVIVRILSDDVYLSVGKEQGFMNVRKNQVEIYKSNNNNHVVMDRSCSLPFTLDKGNIYALGFDKTADSVRFYVREIDSGMQILKEFSETYLTKNDSYLLMWGKPYFTVYEGEVSLLDTWITAPYRDPVLSIFGDSFIEGTGLLVNGIERRHRWSSSVVAALGKERCLVDGKGGEKISERFIKRFKIENTWYKTPYVILALGTNNYSNVEEYKKYMSEAISILKHNGQIPVLVTVTPRVDYDYEPVRLINEWIKSQNIRYIDIHKAVTLENDPSQWKSDYLLYDGIHPTPAGYKAMYEQVRKDLPDIIH